MKFCFSTLGCVDNTLEESILLAKRFSLEGLELRGVDGEIDNGKISCFKEENATKTKNKKPTQKEYDTALKEIKTDVQAKIKEKYIK